MERVERREKYWERKLEENEDGECEITEMTLVFIYDCGYSVCANLQVDIDGVN